MVLTRAKRNPRPFGVFLFEGSRAVLCCAETKRYAAMIRRYPDAMVGTYDGSVCVTGLLADLSDYLIHAQGALI